MSQTNNGQGDRKHQKDISVNHENSQELDQSSYQERHFTKANHLRIILAQMGMPELLMAPFPSF